MIVVAKPPCEPGAERLDARVSAQINVLVFHAPPQSLDEHIIHPPALPIHADRDAFLLQRRDPFLRRKLAALIRVENLRAAELGNRFFQRFYAKKNYPECWTVARTALNLLGWISYARYGT